MSAPKACQLRDSLPSRLSIARTVPNHVWVTLRSVGDGHGPTVLVLFDLFAHRNSNMHALDSAIDPTPICHGLGLIAQGLREKRLMLVWAARHVHSEL